MDILNKANFVDLGLPSGILWSKQVKRNVHLSDKDYLIRFGFDDVKIPTLEQFNELFAFCNYYLYEKGGVDFVVLKSRVNDNFLRFYIRSNFYISNPYSIGQINIINEYFSGENSIKDKRKSTNIVSNIYDKDHPLGIIFYMDFINTDVIYIKQ